MCTQPHVDDVSFDQVDDNTESFSKKFFENLGLKKLLSVKTQDDAGIPEDHCEKAKLALKSLSASLETAADENDLSSSIKSGTNGATEQP